MLVTLYLILVFDCLTTLTCTIDNSVINASILFKLINAMSIADVMWSVSIRKKREL